MSDQDPGSSSVDHRQTLVSPGRMLWWAAESASQSKREGGSARSGRRLDYCPRGAGNRVVNRRGIRTFVLRETCMYDVLAKLGGGGAAAEVGTGSYL